MTDAGTHVPLIASWPGTIPAGHVSLDLIDFSDFLPTLLDCAGIAPPPDRVLDGQSFLPQLRGEEGDPREWIYSWFSRTGQGWREFARTHRYKLFKNGRFFDLIQDPEQEEPLESDALDANARSARDLLEGVLDRYKDTRPARLKGR